MIWDFSWEPGGRSVDAHRGGIAPRAGAFGADGADAGGEPGADRLGLDEEAGLADRDDGERVPRDQVGVVDGGTGEDLDLLEVGIGDAGPAGFDLPFIAGVLHRETGRRDDGTGTAGRAAELPADADEGFIPAVEGFAGGGGGAEAIAAIVGLQIQGGALGAQPHFPGSVVGDGCGEGFPVVADGGEDGRGEVRIEAAFREPILQIRQGIEDALRPHGGDLQLDSAQGGTGGEDGLEGELWILKNPVKSSQNRHNCLT